MGLWYGMQCAYDDGLWQDERDAIIARSVKEIEEKTTLCAAAEKERNEKTREAEKLKACLEGVSVLPVC
jgi:hypothetical protein